MAKQGPKGDKSHIRFIMIDAEIPEGDLREITSAIQNALKPATIIQQRITNNSAPALPSSAGNRPADDVIEGEAVEAEDQPVADDTPRPAREPKTRKPTVPKVIELDLTTEVSLHDFVAKHPPKTEPERSLVVAAYFKENRSEDSITVNHVYTCYRFLKWPSGIEDFAWPLRYLKKEQLMSSPGRGQYSINHLGLARVQKLGAE